MKSNDKTIIMTNEQENIVKQFKDYLSVIRRISDRSRTNYVSWTKWLIVRFDLQNLYTKEGVDEIMNKIKTEQSSESHYYKKKDLTNFKSTLNHFLKFNRCRLLTENAKKQFFSIDSLIDMIRFQDTLEHAKLLNDAIRLICFEKNVVLSSKQKETMKANTKSVSNKVAHYTQHFYPNSNAIVYNN